MNIIFFCKRQYMQKDVIDDRYARLYELPNQLALQGHKVRGICLGYRSGNPGYVKHHQDNDGLLEWYGFDVGALMFPGLVNYLTKTFALVKSFNPDLLLGSSDCLHAVITAFFSKLFNIPYYLDLYDNYESFGMARIPGLKPMYRGAIKGANGISCVSEPLSVFIRDRYRHPNVMTVESTINRGQFFPVAKELCREKLGLPFRAKIIGASGSLSFTRNIDLIYRGFLELAELDSEVHLALAGTEDRNYPIPTHPRVHYLGNLNQIAMNEFYNALDLAIIGMRDSEFGRYAFPQKTYEILSTQTPVLATNVGAVGQTFREHPACLYSENDLADFCQKAANLLYSGRPLQVPIPTWQDQARRLFEWIQP